MLIITNVLYLFISIYIASIIISSNIGRIYSELGYSGKAEVEFLLAEKMIRQKPCSDEAELCYILFYSSHLAKIGELDKR